MKTKFFLAVGITVACLCLDIGAVWATEGGSGEGGSGCKTAEECACGEICETVQVGTGPEVGRCMPAGCQSDVDCGADETCECSGPGEARCVSKGGSDSGGGSGGGGGGGGSGGSGSGGGHGGGPGGARPPAPTTKPDHEVEKGPAKINLVIKGGPVDSRALARALSRLSAELEDKFRNSSVKKPTNITLYVVGGAELTGEDRAFFIAQGFSPEKLDEAFARGSKLHGLANPRNNAIIIPATKATNLGEIGFGNTLKHEVGHVLVGRVCSDHERGNPDACGGVMVAEPSTGFDLEYTPQFRDIVIQMHLGVAVGIAEIIQLIQMPLR